MRYNFNRIIGNLCICRVGWNGAIESLGMLGCGTSKNG